MGYSEAPATLPASRLMFFEQTIVGSLGCRPADYPRILQLVETERFRLDPLVSHEFPLEKINEAAGLLRNGTSLRSIVQPAPR